MITNQQPISWFVGKRPWQPSWLFKTRIRAAPIPEPHIAEKHAQIRVWVEQPTQSVDLQFPEIRTINLSFPNLPSPSLSEDLGGFDETLTYLVNVEELFEEVLVSDDLFVPLGGVLNDGRTYARGESDDEKQRSFPPAPIRDREGYRQAFTETRHGLKTRRKFMSIWDLILPLLQPPLYIEDVELAILPNPLYPFQIDGVNFLASQYSALLGDDMGIGKTVQTIVAMRILLQTGEISAALIVVPLALLKNWDRELLKWAPNINGVQIVRGTKDKREMQWHAPAHIWITSYGTVRSDIDYIVDHKHFDLVVLDEIQAVKNADSQQTQAAKQLPRQRAWGLSGTPIENKLDDLLSIFDFLKPGLLPLTNVAPERAKELIKPYFLRRRKKGCSSRSSREKSI